MRQIGAMWTAGAASGMVAVEVAALKQREAR